MVTKLLELHAHTDVIDRVSDICDCCTILFSATSSFMLSYQLIEYLEFRRVGIVCAV